MARIVMLLAGTMLIGPASVASADAGHTETVYLAGGCYWGVEAVFEHVKGVKSVVSGFVYGKQDSTAGVLRRPNHAGYAEAVRIKYDPEKISYTQLLQIFFTVAHDPTQLDRQGPDVGPQYRSSLFVTDTSQMRIAAAYLDSVRKAAQPHHPVVTDLVLFDRFRMVEESQQDFAVKNPSLPYIVINDLPKIAHLKAQYAALYRS